MALTNSKNIQGKINNLQCLLKTIDEELENKAFNTFDSNILYIVPNIKQEWISLCKNNKVTPYEMLDLCELWVEELAVAAVSNQKHMKNKKLAAHISELTNICKLIVSAVQHDLTRT